MGNGVRRVNTKQSSGTGVGISGLLIPDPRTWPEEIRSWFRGATSDGGPLDVFIFNHGRLGCLYLQDAVTAAAVMDIDISEWHTERGYPVFCFHAERIGEIQHRLGIMGYKVHVLELVERRSPPGRRQGTKVLSIAVGREKGQRAQKPCS